MNYTRENILGIKFQTRYDTYDILQILSNNRVELKCGSGNIITHWIDGILNILNAPDTIILNGSYEIY